jgi:hypothetical protein
MNGHDTITIVLEAGGYSIGLVNDTQYDPDSADNVSSYDRGYSDEHCDNYRYTPRHGIRVFSDDKTLTSCSVCSSGGSTSIHPTCSLLDGNHLLLCCGDSVFSLTIPELDLSWRTKADSTTCFEIFAHNDGYIVHGELELSRLSRDGSIIWQFSGSDIFVTHAGTNDFVLEGDLIHATDWNGLEFTLDATTGKHIG